MIKMVKNNDVNILYLVLKPAGFDGFTAIIHFKGIVHTKIKDHALR